MAKSLERMDNDKLSNHIKTAEKFLNTLT